MNRVNEITKWLSTTDHVKKVFGNTLQMDTINIECLKKTRRINVWKIQCNEQQLILKIYTSQTSRNRTEITLLNKRINQISQFMPNVYWIGSPTNKDEVWVLMEYVQQLRGQIKMHPSYFKKIIPSITRLHVNTFVGREAYKEVTQIIPHYHSMEMIKKRKSSVNKTIVYLKKAMKKEHLQPVIEPYFEQTLSLLNKGPEFFPELIREGECLIHGDLHLQNICCHNVLEEDWHLHLIDWETARCSSGWIDLAILVEVLLDFRKDWQDKAEEIRNDCVHLYASYLKKHGIKLSTDPMKLFKMAYLQRTFEKGLYTQLKRELQGRRGVLLETYLRKINTWGPELGL